MLHEGYFDKVYYRFWEINNPKANVFAIHGLGGHCKWFDEAGKLFNEKEVNLFSFDLPGFGQSKYPIGTIDSYKTWIKVTKETLEKYLYSFNVRMPVFILGHSMGALISILLAKNVKANGWILSVPGFEGDKRTWTFKNFILPAILKSLFQPEEKISMPFGPELITKNKERQKKIKQDLLRVVAPAAKVFFELYLLAEITRRTGFSEECPVIMLEAGKDMICSNEAADRYFNEIKLKDKTKKIYEYAFHDLFLEDELEQIVSDLTVWIKERLTI